MKASKRIELEKELSNALSDMHSWGRIEQEKNDYGYHQNLDSDTILENFRKAEEKVAKLRKALGK